MQHLVDNLIKIDMNGRKLNWKYWTSIVLGILIFSAVFLLSTIFDSLVQGALSTALARGMAGVDSGQGNWRAVLNVALLFSVLGAYFGTIFLLDGRSEFASRNHPVLRTTLCGALSAVAVLLIQSTHPDSFHAGWVGLGFVIGAALGAMGWRWARHVNF